MSTRVLLVDDQAVVRAGIRVLIELTDDLIICGEAADGTQAVQMTRALKPDVVLMDIRMPRSDGITATRQITHDPDLADVRIIALTTFDTDEHLFGALAAGAAGFLLKDVEATHLQDAIRTVARGDSLLDPAITRRVLDELTQRATPTAHQPERLDQLTDREREATRLAATGLTNQQIAEHLHVSPHTAKTHINRAMTKLHARDRGQLVTIAYQTGLATLDPS
ncbi:MAG: response regulator transcription factor [Micrococcales bacterium]|nr:response regulator transcription factor [Micrococcales bacterium]